jgi:UDP-N-acetylmuramoylalanine--D-glutamate ligase
MTAQPIPSTHRNATARPLVVGMGKTGYSLACWLARQGISFDAVDSREDPPFLREFRRDFPDCRVQTGGFAGDLLANAREVLLSPGIDPALPPIAAASAGGARVCGDMELFWRAAQAPILAITGTNAKSTVTTLVGLMAQAAGIRSGCGGNLGVPALDLLDPLASLYVLELSSFQLDIVVDFRAEVGAYLNLAPDHLDRYASMEAYGAAKQRIFRGCRVAVFNRADARTRPVTPVERAVSFGLDAPAEGDYGLILQGADEWLARGAEPLMPAHELALRGRHNLANALAALAVAESGGIPREACLGVLRSYRGLPHRCQRVALAGGVDYIDDSKGTNVAAAVAALQGLAPPAPSRVLLIAGGIAKEHEFDALAAELARCARVLLLIGRDALRIAEGVAGACPVEHCADLESAVQRAAVLAQPGDVVLLSPACASFDMFRNYEHRGEAFAAAARALPGAEVA